ncbi:hypothetical protein PV726_18075 [Streptomyces europaeiscabiei]|uniref:hypothetical protein n=1 Tax=Streptomyces europaeiscabiei TaxID=146819 RepID=UPI0029A24C31|nr:hypothetical protein [Streptomyces europaeiscabiei]MDX3692220.1 hypothetical protein [Streptomyces europaeiscabiei]
MTISMLTPVRLRTSASHRSETLGPAPARGSRLPEMPRVEDTETTVDGQGAQPFGEPVGPQRRSASTRPSSSRRP